MAIKINGNIVIDDNKRFFGDNTLKNFFAAGSGNITTIGANNIFFGNIAGCSNTDGCNNNFFGNYAGRYNQGGSFNNFFGNVAGQNNTGGSCNNFFGSSAGKSNTTSIDNNFFGTFAGCSNTTGSTNNFIGFSAGLSSTTTCNNNFIGCNAGRCNNGGTSLVFLGRGAGQCTIAGTCNNFIGQYAGACSEGNNNNSFGHNAGFTNSGSHNNFFGNDAGKGTLDNTGTHNNYFGLSVGKYNTTGSCNNFFGCQAGFLTTTGSNNNYIGVAAGQNNITGNLNTFVGANSGQNMTGSCNVVLGSFIGTSFLACNNHVFVSSGSGEIRAHFNASGALGFASAVYGTAGHVLTSNGSNAAPSWTAAGVGDGNKGDITVASSGTSWTINAGAVTNADLANVATATFKGRTTAGTGVPEDLSATQATALLNSFAGSLKGLVPASSGGTTNFLRADGSWSPGGSTAINNSPSGVVFPTMSSTTSGSLSTAFTSSGALTFDTSTGTLSATQFTSLSDINKKKNIRTIENAIDITKKLEGVRFDWKHNDAPSIGVIAQEVEKVLPELVVDTDGVKSVSYGNIVGVLIEAIKEQQIRIEELERKLNG
jgi:hypothetical protein